MHESNRPIRLEFVLAISIAAAVSILGIAALTFSWIPLSTIEAWLAGAAFDGKADFFTIERHHRIIVGSRGVGIAFMVAGAILWIMRRRMAFWLKNFSIGLGDLVSELVNSFRGIRDRSEAWHWAALGLVMCLAFVLRLIFIGLPIRYDEATTYMEYASKPIPILLSYYSSPNNHIFHSLLVHISTWLFGDGLLAIRLPALLAGWLIVPACYLAFRLLYDKRVGLMAAALTAICPVLVQFSVNARGYTLTTLFFLILLSLMANLREKHNPAGWVLVCLISALGLWTIPIMIFPIAVVCFWWLLSTSPGQSILTWRHFRPLLFTMTATVFLTATLYMPVVIGSGWEMLWSASGAANRESIHHLMLNALIAPWNLATRFWPDLLVFALGGLILIGFFTHWVMSHRGVWIGFAVIAGPYLVLLIFRSNPFERVWLFATPVILGICAVGLTWLSRRLNYMKRSKLSLAAAAVTLTLGLGLFTALSAEIPASEEGSTLHDARAITKRIAMQWQKGDAVLTACPVDEPLAYHFNRQGLPVAPVFALITNRLEKADRIWVVTKHPYGPSLANLLKQAGPQVKAFIPPVVIKRFPQASIYLMERNR
jgi:hypothetical protein